MSLKNINSDQKPDIQLYYPIESEHIEDSIHILLRARRRVHKFFKKNKISKEINEKE